MTDLAHLTYNGTDMAEDACWFTRHSRPIIGKTGRRNFIHEQWVIHGRVNGLNTAEVDAARVAFESTLVDGGDLSFSLGSTQRLISANTVQGTHIRELTWLTGTDGVRGSGAEDVLRRTFRLVIDGLLRMTSDTDVIEYHETVQGVGTTGPRILPVGSLTGDITPQQTQLHTKCEAIQSGYVIGLTQYPNPSTPIWISGLGGVYEYFERRRNTLHSPQQIGINQSTGYKRSWSYHFWSGSPLVGSPNFF